MRIRAKSRFRPNVVLAALLMLPLVATCSGSHLKVAVLAFDVVSGSNLMQMTAPPRSR